LSSTRGLVSILMPVKNAAPFLEDCLSSIVHQSETDWELIAINDASSDESRTILERFATLDPRISVIDNTGKGIIDALRLAYVQSKGEFITRMDADDRMASNKLKVLKRDLLKHGTGHLAIGLVSYFSDGELGDGYRYYESWLNSLSLTGSNYRDIYRECVIPSPCWMVRRTDFDRCGAFHPNTYPEDYDLCFRFYQAGLKPIPISTVLHHWRDHSTRSSRTDPNYADNRFLDLKLKWFLKIDHESERPLVIWGASSKGKSLAKGLLEANVAFQWICNNPNKIGKKVYDKLIGNVDAIGDLQRPQVIVAVANKEEQADIRSHLREDEAFFFC
jgi:glycosyltransferase involved in cell wall biosynthesis